MQFTRHEMPINIKIENDLLLWEIEVISVRHLILNVLFLSFPLLHARNDIIMIYIIAISKPPHRKKRREDFFIWTSKEKLLLLQNSQHNE